METSPAPYLTNDSAFMHELNILEVTRAPHGCRHSPARMLRVGQGNTSDCSIPYSMESKKVTSHVNIVYAYSSI